MKYRHEYVGVLVCCVCRSLASAQSSALQQLDSLEASLRSKLEGHHKQVGVAGGVSGLCVWVGGAIEVKMLAVAAIRNCAVKWCLLPGGAASDHKQWKESTSLLEGLLIIGNWMGDTAVLSSLPCPCSPSYVSQAPSPLSCCAPACPHCFTTLLDLAHHCPPPSPLPPPPPPPHTHTLFPQVSEVLSRGLSDVEEHASELAQRQERLLQELTHSSSSMAAAMKQTQ
jgi:hypothetical protein